MKKIKFIAVAIVLSTVFTASCPPADGSLNYTVLLPNPNDCSTFFSCSNGVPILMHCPDGLHFNNQLDICDWPQYAGCADGGGDEKKTKCISRSTDNTGRCTAAADGSGDVCADSYWFEFDDCYAHE